MPESFMNMNEDRGVNRFPRGAQIDDRYVITEYIGSGASGDVYKAIARDFDGQIVAIKFLNLQSDENATDRFKREVRSLESISHQNVIKVLDKNLEHSPPYFVMPLAEMSLESQIPFINSDKGKCLAITKEVCMGLFAIHNAGITHRDIKPSNVLIFKTGKVVISDFGIAKFNDRDTRILTQTSDRLGTIAYCAPEQLIDGGSRGADSRTDVYQLGKTLYELFTGDNPAIIDDEKLDQPLAAIVEKATHNKPDRRYQNLSEMFDALLSYERYLNPEAPTQDRFTDAISEANELLKENKFRSSNILTILRLLGDLNNTPSEYIDAFYAIPIRLIPTFAKTLESDFTEAVNAYAKAIKSGIRGYTWSYAEEVAERMESAFEHASSPKLKTAALRCTLLAAVERNRFAAMDIFDKMLLKIKSTDEIFFVAEMLREEIDSYRVVADRISPNQLPTSIRAIQAKALEDD